jgi:hypothetical protein
MQVSDVAFPSVAAPSPLDTSSIRLLTLYRKSVWRKKRIPVSGATDVVFSSVRSFFFIPFAFKEFNDNWKTRSQSNGVVGSSSPAGCRDQTAIVCHMPGVGKWYTFNSRRIQAGIGGPKRTTLTPLIILANQNGSVRGRIWRISKMDHSFFRAARDRLFLR